MREPFRADFRVGPRDGCRCRSGCLECGGHLDRVIYMGLPGRFCFQCETLSGPASYIALVFFNGVLWTYDCSRSWLYGLWSWLTGGGDDD